MSRNQIRATFIAASLTLVSAAASRGADATAAPASDSSSSASTASSDGGTTELDQRPHISLSLAQAVQMAIDQNFDVQLQDLSLLNSKESYNSAKLEFHPTLTVTSTLNASQREATGTAASPSPHTDNGTLGAQLSEKISTGATVSLNTTVLSRNNTVGASNSPSYGRSVTLSVSQPLLRGFGPKYTLNNLHRSEISLSQAYLSYRNFLINTVNSIETAYTNLIVARQQLDISQSSLDLTQQTYDENVTRNQVGLVTDLNLLNSKNQLLSSQNTYETRLLAVRNAEDSLRLLLGGQEFDVGIVPTDDLTDEQIPVPTVESAYQIVLNNGIDYQNRQYSVQLAEMQVNVAKSNLKPQLNLTGSVTTSDSGVNSSGNAWDRASERENYGWSIGLSLNVPLGERTERIGYRTALNNLQTAQVQLKQFEQSTMASVRSTINSIETNRRQVDLAVQQVEYSRQSYEAEQVRYEAGASTQRTLNQALNDYDSARFNLLQARLNLRTQYNNLRRLEGTTLDRYQITLPQ